MLWAGSFDELEDAEFVRWKRHREATGECFLVEREQLVDRRTVAATDLGQKIRYRLTRSVPQLARILFVDVEDVIATPLW